MTTETKPTKTEKTPELAPGPEARVLIAKDVLAQIKAKKIIPEHGFYLSMKDGDLSREIQRLADEEPKKLSTKKLENCGVCAIGAVFVATFNRVDGLTNQRLDHYIEYDGPETWSRYLSKWFPTKQLRLMETVFEGSEIGGSISSKQFEKAMNLRDKLLKGFPEYGDSSARAEKLLTGIMKNVIKNNGTFVV